MGNRAGSAGRSSAPEIYVASKSIRRTERPERMGEIVARPRNPPSGVTHGRPAEAPHMASAHDLYPGKHCSSRSLRTLEHDEGDSLVGLEARCETGAAGPVVELGQKRRCRIVSESRGADGERWRDESRNRTGREPGQKRCLRLPTASPGCIVPLTGLRKRE